MPLCCELSYCSIQLPRYNQVLTGVLPYNGGTRGNVINDIRHGIRPPRPASRTQDQWLKDGIWDMILTCWSKKPEQRCELAVVHHAFSTPSLPDALVEFLPAGRNNLIRLTKELLYTFLVLPLDPPQRATLRKVQEYISDVISRDGAAPTILSSAEVTAFTETRREVSLPRYISVWSLKPMMDRQRRSYYPPYDLPRFACGSGFIPTPSSSTHRSSRT
jgi:hypothetical protein